MAPSKDNAKRAGRDAISGLRGTLAQGVARLLKRDPDLLSEMVELGLVRHEWLEDPASEPVSTATPMEVAQRWLERSVEQRPSVLGKLGLNTIQLLSSTVDGSDSEGVATRVAVVCFAETVAADAVVSSRNAIAKYAECRNRFKRPKQAPQGFNRAAWPKPHGNCRRDQPRGTIGAATRAGIISDFDA